MIRRLSRAMLALSLAAPLVILGGIKSSTAIDSPNRAFAEIAQCLNTRDILNVLFVVDASASLQETDPKNLRAEVLATSLGQLAGAREGTKVNFQLSTFGQKYTIQYPNQDENEWQSLSPSSLRSAQTWIRSQVPELNKEAYTDWQVALKRGQRDLAASPDAAKACRIMLWLTDGGIDVRGDDESKAVGEICGVDPKGRSTGKPGVVDSIRRSGISLIGVLLKSEAYLAGKRRSDPDEYKRQISRMSYMRAIVESAGPVDGASFGALSGNFTCGASPIPDSDAAGALIEVNDASDLGLSFARIWADASGGQIGTVVGDNPYTFTVEPGVARAVLLLRGQTWSLTNPAGAVVASQASKSAPVTTVQETSGAWLVEVQTSDPSSRGSWTIVTKGAEESIAEVYFYSDLSMRLDSQPEMGRPAQINGNVTNLFGDDVGLSEFGKVSLDVRVIDTGLADGRIPLALDKATGAFSGSFTAPDGVSVAIFDVTLNLATQSGQQLKPVSKRFEVEVALGPGYPTITPGELSMTKMFKPGDVSTGVLTIKAAQEAGVKVCVVAQDVASDPLPSRIEKYEWSGDPCVTVPAGQERTLTVKAKNPVGAEGLVSGALTLEVTPDNLAAKRLDVPFSFYSAFPPNRAIFVLVLLLLSLLSVGLPWAILHWANRRNARLIGGDLIRRAEVAVLLANGGIYSAGSGPSPSMLPLTIDPATYRFASVADIARNYQDGSSVVFTGVAPMNPFGSPKVRVEPHPTVVIPGDHLGTDLGTAWFVVLNPVDQSTPESGPVPGQLISLIRSAGTDIGAIQQRTAEIQSSGVWARVPELVAEHRKQQEAHAAKVATNSKSARDSKRLRKQQAQAEEKGIIEVKQDVDDDWDTPIDSSVNGQQTGPAAASTQAGTKIDDDWD